MECRLMDRECTNCGECERCDLDPDKICDNCCACLGEMPVDYAAIPVTMPRVGGAVETEGAAKTKIRSEPRKKRR